MRLPEEILSKAATQARGLAMDAVHACESGHLGLPLGCAEMGAVLFGHVLRLNPDEPKWINRDRVVLSAGHGSMWLYGWLHLSGFDLPLEEIKNFRQLESITPGHPEQFMTPGVEATTGPLGQGVGNAVGFAVSGKMAQAHFNTAEHQIFDSHVVCLAGDGCLQEGISHEASAFAAHFGLDNLILIFDSNKVTLDAAAEQTQSEDFAGRYRAYGWDVQEIDGHNMQEFLDAIERAKAADNGKPQFIIADTLVGKGIPEVAGTYKAHGEAGAKFVEEARRNIGLPEEHFYISDEVREFFAKHKEDLLNDYAEWRQRYDAWRSANPDKAELLDKALAVKAPDGLLDEIPKFDPEESAKLATRAAGGKVLQPIAKAMPWFISGSADLHGSTKNWLDDQGDFGRENFAGRNIRFGIREHGMTAICNGLAYDGIFRPSGATFMTFSDYARPSIRLAALSGLPVLLIYTHDSVGVGEDGPTHQPVETVAALRAIPNLDVIRPADPEETAGAFVAALERTDGPTAFSLTRQSVPLLTQIPVDERRRGVTRGAYIARREEGALETILLASGSELQHALAAAEQLGAGTRVVSMPCMERFERQDAQYQEETLPAGCRRRVAIEAGVKQPWYRYVGLDGRIVGLDRFGLSAPGSEVMKHLGMTAEAVVQAARELA